MALVKPDLQVYNKYHNIWKALVLEISLYADIDIRSESIWRRKVKKQAKASQGGVLSLNRPIFINQYKNFNLQLSDSCK